MKKKEFEWEQKAVPTEAPQPTEKVALPVPASMDKK
jgi:hypothetical protein